MNVSKIFFLLVITMKATKPLVDEDEDVDIEML